MKLFFTVFSMVLFSTIFSYGEEIVNAKKMQESSTTFTLLNSDEYSSAGLSKDNCIHFELFGTCLFYSINYERLILTWFSMKFGASYLEQKCQLFNLSTIFLFELYDKNIEIGLGVTHNTDKTNFIKSNTLQTTTIGIRNFLPKGYFVSRIGLMTIWNIDYNKFFPYLYGSLGLMF